MKKFSIITKSSEESILFAQDLSIKIKKGDLGICKRGVVGIAAGEAAHREGVGLVLVIKVVVHPGHREGLGAVPVVGGKAQGGGTDGGFRGIADRECGTDAAGGGNKQLELEREGLAGFRSDS